MRFEQRLRDGIADGSVTVMFRRWRRTQAVAGHRYRTGRSIIEVDSVEVVNPAKITKADARRAGYGSVAGLAADDALSADEVGELDRRMDRLDRASATGPWTAATLAAIANHPGTRAADLAAAMGREKAPFKIDVRKLKNLGLTHSLEVGYRLSPRGAAYLRLTNRVPGPLVSRR